MNKSQKPTPTLARPQMQLLTEEQKLAQRAQIFMQKKESYALNAALKMIEVHKPKTETDMKKIVLLADKFSDLLLETLFKDKEDEDSEKDSDKED